MDNRFSNNYKFFTDLFAPTPDTTEFWKYMLCILSDTEHFKILDYLVYRENIKAHFDGVLQAPRPIVYMSYHPYVNDNEPEGISVFFAYQDYQKEYTFKKKTSNNITDYYYNGYFVGSETFVLVPIVVIFAYLPKACFSFTDRPVNEIPQDLYDFYAGYRARWGGPFIGVKALHRSLNFTQQDAMNLQAFEAYYLAAWENIPNSLPTLFLYYMILLCSIHYTNQEPGEQQVRYDMDQAYLKYFPKFASYNELTWENMIQWNNTTYDPFKPVSLEGASLKPLDMINGENAIVFSINTQRATLVPFGTMFTAEYLGNFYYNDIRYLLLMQISIERYLYEFTNVIVEQEGIDFTPLSDLFFINLKGHPWIR